jgi:Ca-activated chloride channel family protein
MRFAHWPFLILIPLVFALHRLWKRQNQPPSVKFPLPIPAFASKFDRQTVLLVLQYIGLSFLLIALARPQTSHRQIDRNVNGIDIMMVMDFSQSMNIEDMGSRSRFDIAKEVMESFIQGRKDDRIGFVIFAGESLTLAPPTLDYDIVLRALRLSEMGVLKDGTAIGDGLAAAVSRLRNSTAKSRIIVLLTDGESNVGQVDPLTAGDLAAGFGIKVYSIAIGRDGKVDIPIKKNGVVVSVMHYDNTLNTELLEKISTATKGKFYRVEDENTLTSVFKEIDSLERTEIKSIEKVRYDEKFHAPLLAGLLTLALAQILGSFVWRSVP